MVANLPQLYTSTWQNHDLACLEVTPTGISRGMPRWRTPYRYRLLRLLAPSREAFALRNDNEFDQAYVAGLKAIGIEKIATVLRHLSEEHGGKPLVLLCYEDVHAGQACHRRTLARWIEEKTDQEVPELVPGMIATTPRAAEPRLF